MMKNTRKIAIHFVVLQTILKVNIAHMLYPLLYIYYSSFWHQLI